MTMEYEEIIDGLEQITGWNDFAASLVSQYKRKGSLSERQYDAAERMLLKIEATKARKAEAAAKAVTINLQPVVEMFATARASGYKKPVYRALGLRIKPHWKGDGLAVYTEDRWTEGNFGPQPGYEGQIAGGTFTPVGATLDTTFDRLIAIAADPRGEAVRHGQRTGRCSCCGRELTKHASIDAGIGPICAEKWGL